MQWFVRCPWNCQHRNQGEHKCAEPNWKRLTVLIQEARAHRQTTTEDIQRLITHKTERAQNGRFVLRTTLPTVKRLCRRRTTRLHAGIHLLQKDTTSIKHTEMMKLMRIIMAPCCWEGNAWLDDGMNETWKACQESSNRWKEEQNEERRTIKACKSKAKIEKTM